MSMKLLARFQRLTLWNKIGFFGSVASILGLLMAIVFEVLEPEPFREAVSVETAVDEKLRRLTAENLGALSPDMRGGGISPRYADDLLGTPKQEGELSRSYVLEGHRIELEWAHFSTPSKFVIGPSEASESEPLDEIVLSGLWGSFEGSFEGATIGDVLDSSNCWLSDWNYGARGRCFNFLEIECGGSQHRDHLYHRAGIDSCHFSQKYLNAEAIALLDRPGDELTELESHDFLDHPKVRQARINFFMVTDEKRECPRGAGC